MVGCELADIIAGPGDNPMNADNAVTIVEMLPEIAPDEVPAARMLLMQRLREKGVNCITSATVKEILEDGVVIVMGDQEDTIRGMDHIILACGVKSVDDLSERIRDKVPEVYVVGDAKEPRRALEAISEGMEVALKI